MNCPDNYSQWAKHDAEQESELGKRPICEYCEQPIQDEYAYYIEGAWYCEECMNANFRKEVVPEYD